MITLVDTVMPLPQLIIPAGLQGGPGGEPTGGAP